MHLRKTVESSTACLVMWKDALSARNSFVHEIRSHFTSVAKVAAHLLQICSCMLFGHPSWNIRGDTKMIGCWFKYIVYVWVRKACSDFWQSSLQIKSSLFSYFLSSKMSSYAQPRLYSLVIMLHDLPFSAIILILHSILLFCFLKQIF